MCGDFAGIEQVSVCVVLLTDVFHSVVLDVFVSARALCQPLHVTCVSSNIDLGLSDLTITRITKSSKRLVYTLAYTEGLYGQIIVDKDHDLGEAVSNSGGSVRQCTRAFKTF